MGSQGYRVPGFLSIVASMAAAATASSSQHWHDMLRHLQPNDGPFAHRLATEEPYRKRVRHPISCADVWLNPVDPDGPVSKTCGQAFLEVLGPRSPALFALAANSVAQRYPAQCSACNFSFTAAHTYEATASRVRCVAACLPGGRTNGRNWCADVPAEELPTESCLAPGDDSKTMYQQASLAPKDSTPPAWHERGSLAPIKLVINAAANRDSLPLAMLFQSLAEAKFPFGRVVVVSGGSSIEDAEPRFTRIADVIPNRLYALSNPATKEQHVVWIRTPFMNYDLHGLAVLGRHHKHPLVHARGYLYVLETTLVDSMFANVLTGLDSLLLTPNTILMPPLPSANVALMASGVPGNFGLNFERRITKRQGLMPEHGIPVLTRHACDTTYNNTARQLDTSSERCRETEDDQEHIVYPLSSFGDVTVVGRRVPLCGQQCTVYSSSARVDVYATGKARVAFLYKAFGLQKYVYWGGNGDLTPLVTEQSVHTPISSADSSHRDAWKK